MSPGQHDATRRPQSRFAAGVAAMPITMADDPVQTSALDVQEGGNHYKDLAIQPVEYIHANGIGYFEGNVIKYVSRWRAKGGIKDLEKAKHYIDLLIELEQQ
jgi:hypothetical protein